MAEKNLKQIVAKKLKLLADYQKLVQLLNKEGDKIEEYKGEQKDNTEISKIKAKLNAKS